MLAFQHRFETLSDQAFDDLKAVLKAGPDADPPPVNPFERLKREALSHIAVMQRMCCHFSAQSADADDYGQSHRLAVMEGRLDAAFDLINQMEIEIQ